MTHDPVNHPSHYTYGGIKTIDVIEAWERDYHIGNAIKYLSRWERKGGIEDLEKSLWYIRRKILLESGQKDSLGQENDGLRTELAKKSEYLQACAATLFGEARPRIEQLEKQIGIARAAFPAMRQVLQICFKHLRDKGVNTENIEECARQLEAEAAK